MQMAIKRLMAVLFLGILDILEHAIAFLSQTHFAFTQSGSQNPWHN
jgi:hypothetical protein